MKLSRLIIIFLVLATVVSLSCFYVVPEGKQVIITQFGKPVGGPITVTGVHFKKPLLHKVIYVEKRILTWDGYPNQIPTRDKKYISVDTTARWKIVDPLKFIQSVQNERGAKARLDSILDANTRDVISKHRLVEVVRNSNQIIERVKKPSTQSADLDEEFTGEVASIEVGREKLSKMIALESDQELRAFGISIIDVQLRRISYEKSVESKVFERMISERQRIAEKIRSIGRGEKAKIEGRLERDLKRIESIAYQKAQVIEGEAEAKSVAIFAQALSENSQFYEFYKSLDAYKKALKAGHTKMIMSTDTGFFKALKGENSSR